MADNRLSIKVIGTLDKTVTTAEINKALNQIESKINKLTLKVDVNDSSLKSLNNLPKTLNSVSKPAQQASASLNNIAKSAQNAHQHTLSLGDALKQAAVKFPLWVGISSVFFGIISAAKGTVNIIVDLDMKLINLKKVMDQDTNFERIMDSASDSASRFGKTISEVMDAYTEFARQGYKEQDLINLGDAGLIASNVGEISAQQAAEYLTSAMVQFNMETKDSMQVIDA